MPTRIDLPKDLVYTMLNTNIASLKRSMSTAKTEMVKTAYEHELRQITAAQTTLTEIK